MPTVETPKFMAQRIVAAHIDIDGDEGAAHDIARRITERDAAIRSAALLEAHAAAVSAEYPVTPATAILALLEKP